MTDANETLEQALKSAHENGNEWLLQITVRDTIPLLFNQPRIEYLSFATKQEMQYAIAVRYHLANGYRTVGYRIDANDPETPNPYESSLVGGVHIEHADINRTPMRIRVLPHNRMTDIHRKLVAMFNRELGWALAYEFHRRLADNDDVSMEKLVLELLDQGKAYAHDLPSARSIDRYLADRSPDMGKWFRVAIDHNTTRYIMDLENPDLPYYEAKQTSMGDDYRLKLVIPKSGIGSIEYREIIDEFCPTGVGPYRGVNWWPSTRMRANAASRRC